MSNQAERWTVMIPFVPSHGEDIKALAIEAIRKYESDFRPLLDQFIQEDARYTYLERSLEVDDIDIDSDGGGASITFISNFYSGCKDLNDIEEHEAFLPFVFRDGYMIFDLELPPKWLIQD